MDYPADDVWSVIRPFEYYAWAGVEAETLIEQGEAGDQLGAMRRIVSSGKTTRQILLAHSDAEHFYNYGFVGSPPFPVHDYTATLRIVPVIADVRAFVE